MGAADGILERLRSAAQRDLGDFMVWTVRPDERHPDIQNDGMRYALAGDRAWASELLWQDAAKVAWLRTSSGLVRWDGRN